MVKHIINLSKISWKNHFNFILFIIIILNFLYERCLIFFCMLGVKKQANVSSVAILKYFQKRNLSKMLRRLSPLRKQRKKTFCWDFSEWIFIWNINSSVLIHIIIVKFVSSDGFLPIRENLYSFRIFCFVQENKTLNDKQFF